MLLIKDYYELWNYNYEYLIIVKLGKYLLVVRVYLEIIGDNIEIEWGFNWEDDLVGGYVIGLKDFNI